ncbi:class I SAM-dependent methyltransferase [Allorhizocola rhizosphaerae]|uniref:class I SAM-dependent methyltransferase n=1 Tax=Allorhizocola rhizosphaerae TaxID=1872709 RepID=UPI000E3D54C6|nr:methyltransferase domain-containing protein [Allorhizocola rhizosphaerae]
MDFDAHRLSFGSVAEHYDRVRPTYPRAALEWVLGTQPRRVLDLGAGTGLLSRAVMTLGHEVVAVEPDPGMRARFDAVTPGVTALAGSAEEIPLPDASVDVVVVGQAYHWFNPDRSHPEIARVLKPGGVFAPMWNTRDLDREWTIKLDDILRNPVESGAAEDFGPLFTPIETALFKHSVPQTPDGLCELVKSRSYFIVSPPERQEEILQKVRDLTAELGETFDMPYTTEVMRALKR